jgi:hypothetical protein
VSLDKIQYKLAMHLIGTHCNAAAIAGSWDELSDSHVHEHFGPGGIRGHLYTDFRFDEEKVEEVLEEAEEDECPRPGILSR